MKPNPTKKKTKPSKSLAKRAPRGRGQSNRVVEAPLSRIKTGRYSAPSGAASIRVRRTELIGTLTSPGSNLFAATKVPMNPGLPTTEWLGAVAQNYQQYRLKSFTVEYRGLEPTSTRGTVYLGIQYDVNQKSPVSEIEMSLLPENVSFPVWTASASTSVKPSRFHATSDTYYIRSQFVSDLDRYDGANLVFAIVDHAATDTVGKVWVTYDFELLVPSANLSTGSLRSGDRARVCLMGSDSGTVPNNGTNSGPLLWDDVQSANIPGHTYDSKTGTVTVDQPMRVRSQSRLSLLNATHTSGASDGYLDAQLTPLADGAAISGTSTRATLTVPAAKNTAVGSMALNIENDSILDMIPRVSYAIGFANSAASTVSSFAVAAGAATTWINSFVGLLDSASVLLAATRLIADLEKAGKTPSDTLLRHAGLNRSEYKRGDRKGRPLFSPSVKSEPSVGSVREKIDSFESLPCGIPTLTRSSRGGLL